VGGGAAFVVACNRLGVVLLGLSLRNGEPLWKPQLLGRFPGGSHAINTPPTPIVSEKYGLVFVGVSADVLSRNVSIQARDVTSGAQTWALPVGGHNCTSTRWEATGAFSSTGDLLLLWDNFAVRAVRVATGAEAWTSKLTNVGARIPSIGVGVVNGKAALLMLASRGQRTCDALITPGYLICAVAEDSGGELGCVTAPTSVPPSSSLPPVAVSGDLWLHGETSMPPIQHTVVSAVKASTANSVMFL
jgi:outer membrane protein assembly factor BamB